MHSDQGAFSTLSGSSVQKLAHSLLLEPEVDQADPTTAIGLVESSWFFVGSLNIYETLGNTVESDVEQLQSHARRKIPSSDCQSDGRG